MSTQRQPDGVVAGLRKAAGAGALPSGMVIAQPSAPLQLYDTTFDNVPGRANVAGVWDGRKFSPAYQPAAGSPLRWTNQLEFIKSTVMKALRAKRNEAEWFKLPVDTVKLNVPLYYRSIQHPPIDLKTIQSRLEHYWYPSAHEAIQDFRHMFENAYSFNANTLSAPYQAAKTLQTVFDTIVFDMPITEKELSLPASFLNRHQVVPGATANGVHKPNGSVISNGSRRAKAGKTKKRKKWSAGVSKKSIKESPTSPLMQNSVKARKNNFNKHNSAAISSNDDLNSSSNLSSSFGTMPLDMPLPTAAAARVANNTTSFNNSSNNTSTFKNSITNNNAAAAAVATHAAAAAAVTTKSPVVSKRLRFCYELVCEFWLNPALSIMSEQFLKPVDAVALKLVDYHLVVKRPMDLGTIRRQLEAGHYAAAEEVANDVRLVFSNCIRYNSDLLQVAGYARKLKEHFEVKYGKFLPMDAVEQEAEQKAIIQRALQQSKLITARASSSSSKAASFAAHSSTTSLSSSISSSGGGVMGAGGNEGAQITDRGKKKRRKAELVETIKMEMQQVQQAVAALIADKQRSLADAVVPSSSNKGRKRTIGGASVSEDVKRHRAHSPSAGGGDLRGSGGVFSDSKNNTSSSLLPSLPSVFDESSGGSNAATAARDSKKREREIDSNKASNKQQRQQEPASIWDNTATTPAVTVTDIDVQTALAVDDATLMSYEEKRTLSLDINNKLSEDKLHKILEIIRVREKSSLDSASSNEIEIDFEHLQPSTLRAIQHFVARMLKTDDAAAMDVIDSSSSSAVVEAVPQSSSSSAITKPADNVVADQKRQASSSTTATVAPSMPSANAMTAFSKDVQMPISEDNKYRNVAVTAQPVINHSSPGTSVNKNMPMVNGTVTISEAKALSKNLTGEAVKQQQQTTNTTVPATTTSTAATAEVSVQSGGLQSTQQQQHTPRKTGALERVAANLAATKAANATTVAASSSNTSMPLTSAASSSRLSTLGIAGLAGSSNGAGLAAVDWNNLPAEALGGSHMFNEQFEIFKQKKEVEARVQQLQRSQSQQVPQHAAAAAAAAGTVQRTLLTETPVTSRTASGGSVASGISVATTTTTTTSTTGSMLAVTTMSPSSSDSSSATSSTAGGAASAGGGGGQAHSQQNDRGRQREIERERRRKAAQFASLEPQQSAVADFFQEGPGTRFGGGNW